MWLKVTMSSVYIYILKRWKCLICSCPFTVFWTHIGFIMLERKWNTQCTNISLNRFKNENSPVHTESEELQVIVSPFAQQSYPVLFSFTSAKWMTLQQYVGEGRGTQWRESSALIRVIWEAFVEEETWTAAGNRQRDPQKYTRRGVVT